jgi:hypothetical protein
MERNVHSFRVAIKKGYSPCLYSYDATKIPLGEFEAKLDFKTWSKRIIAINCYFTKPDTGDKFVVTVYCNYQTGKYTVGDSKVDFSNCPLNEIYRIQIGRNPMENIVLLMAEASALSSL